MGKLSGPPRRAYRALRPYQKRRCVLLVLWTTVAAAALSGLETSVPSTSWTSVAGQQKGQLQQAKLSRANLIKSDPYTGVRVGEAAVPGLSDEAPDDFMDQLDEDWAEEGVDPPQLCDSDSDAGDSDLDDPRNTECGSDDDTTDGESLRPPRTTSSAEVNVDNVVPPWDARLSPEQIEGWIGAEKLLNIKRSVASWLKAKRKSTAKQEKKAKEAAAPAVIPDGAESLPSECYRGHVTC